MPTDTMNDHAAALVGCRVVAETYKEAAGERIMRAVPAIEDEEVRPR